MKIAFTALLALVLHLAFGWAWTLLAGVVAGVWVVRCGWLIGALGVGLAWAGLVVYNYLVAAGATSAMAGTMGGLLGNLPGAAVVALTVCIGLLLGALGGFAGTQLVLLIGARRGHTSAA